MTPEEIKKIADNSAYKAIDDWKQNKAVGLRRLISDACVDALNSLTERYYLVEKGKVEQEMINANQNIDLFKPYPKVRYANEGVKRVLTKLFGPDIRKEKEE